MAMELILPRDDNEALEVAYRHLLRDGLTQRRVSHLEWSIVRHYLRGCRYFESIEYDSGTVRPAYRNSDGGVPFKYEEVVNSAMTEVGRLMRLDVAPAVLRRAVGLGSLRSSSAAQAALDAIVPYLDLEMNKRAFIENLIHYGVAGILAYHHDDADAQHPESSLGLEVIPPTELVLLPGTAQTFPEAAGIARVRWVPLSLFNERKIAGQKISVDPADPDIEARDVPLGATVHTTANADLMADVEPTQTSRRGAASNISRAKPQQPEKTEKFVRLTEVWVWHPNRRLRYYDVLVGRKVAVSKTYKNSAGTPYLPIGVAVRAEGVGLYGRGFVGPIIPVNVETEAAVQNLLRNVRDLDFMGMTGIPQSLGASESDLRGDGPYRRFFWVDPDPSRPNDKPFSISPTTTGTLPTAIIQMALGLMDRLAQQPQMVTQGEAPGRVDSTPALNFLYQASTLPLGTLASSIASAFGTAYKALLGYAQKWKNVVLNLETLRDDTVIGIRFDPHSGKLSLADNALPDPVEVEVGIRSQLPVDKEAQAMKLQAMLQAGTISQSQFRLTARLLKLDLPIPEDAEWQNYRTAILRNILLFNDGETPGDLGEAGLAPSDYDIPEIHLLVIHRLMSSPEFGLASTEVQEKFGDLLGHFHSLAGSLPEQMEHPEEMAQMLQEEVQGPGGGQEQMMQALQSLQGIPGGSLPSDILPGTSGAGPTE